MDLVDRIDAIGKPAWITLMVFSFIIWWPIGLATLAFLIGSGRMGCGHHSRMSWQERRERWREARDQWRAMRRDGYHGMPSSGNRAFDDYRDETLRRLEDEQKEFSGFLGRLRRAKDKAEFDQFMAERGTIPAGDTQKN